MEAYSIKMKRGTGINGKHYFVDNIVDVGADDFKLLLSRDRAISNCAYKLGVSKNYESIIVADPEFKKNRV